jgi:hypothetical protein
VPIWSENFDGLTPPALPSGWTFVGTWVTTSSEFVSSPNSLTSAGSFGPSVLAAFNNTLDGVSGNVSLTGAMNTSSISDTFDEMGIIIRSSSEAWVGSTAYAAALNCGTGESPYGVVLYSRVSGTNATIGFVTPTGGNTFIANEWYFITLTAAGSTISVTVQRTSDSKYLNSSATWQSGITSCISVTDTTVTGQGYAGVFQYSSAGPNFYFDNLVLSAASTATAYALTGPSVGPASAASSNFSITPNGSTSVTITPSDGSSGGTFTPASLTWSGDNSTKTFTYTSLGPDSVTISTTNNGSLTDPSSLSYSGVVTTTKTFVVQNGNIGSVTVGYTIRNTDGTVFGSRTTTNVTSQGGGTYSIAAAIIPANQAGIIQWDDNGLIFASEPLASGGVTPAVIMSNSYVFIG